MAKKIRIYELARELGLSNEECLELCTELKIGAKSHSSSIEDPMADRVRRLADSKGIRRDPIVDEPAPVKKAAEKKVAEKKAPEKRPVEPAPVEAGDDGEAPAPAVERPPARVVRSTGGISEDGGERPAPRVVRSTGGIPEAPRPAP
ncbi:MAG: hypothetical protein FJW95_16495, partial [Actinobacteria bacterium]|nr:hypothetical protein [Actinomycetota bacterium]